MEVILRIKIPESWINKISSKHSAPIKSLDCMPFGEEGGRGLIEIKATDDELKNIISDLKLHQDVCKISISPSPEGGVLGSVVTKKCVACQALTGSDCFLTSAESKGDGHVEWKLITGEKGSLMGLINELESAGCDVELKKTTHITKRAQLTSRQEQIIRIAFERGYYDMPKKVTIEDLARSFKVSSSTLAEILQRGERKIIDQYFISQVQRKFVCQAFSSSYSPCEECCAVVLNDEL